MALSSNRVHKGFCFEYLNVEPKTETINYLSVNKSICIVKSVPQTTYIISPTVDYHLHIVCGFEISNTIQIEQVFAHI